MKPRKGAGRPSLLNNAGYLAWLSRHGEYSTAAELASEVGVSERTIRAHLRELRITTQEN